MTMQSASLYYRFFLKTVTLIMCCGLAGNLCLVGISLFCLLLRSHLANPVIAKTGL